MGNTTGFQKDIKGSWIYKDPQAYLDYTVDWSDWLPIGNTLSTSVYTVEAISGDTQPLVIEGSAIINETQAVTEISGGSGGNLYTVKNTVTTSGGETEVRRFRIKVEDRYL